MLTKRFMSSFPLMLILNILATVPSFSQNEKPYLKDRGTGIPTSMFGTYINKGEVILYPFYEYYYDKNAEYKPEQFGYNSEIDYRGLYKAHEGLFFLGYGISNWVAFEFEVSGINATQYRSPMDNSGMPPRFNEKGLGDVEGQLRWRYNTETSRRPEFFSYFETVFPFQKNKKLIGTQDWELSLGTGLIKGFDWGTMTVRGAIEYSAAEDKFEIGEYAVEYLKKVSKSFSFYIGVEGTQDELEFITDLQFHLKPWMFVRINNSFGITSKTTDYSPELGVVFYLNKK